MRNTRFDTLLKVKIPSSLAELLEQEADRNLETVSSLTRTALMAELAVRKIREAVHA